MQPCWWLIGAAAVCMVLGISAAVRAAEPAGPPLSAAPPTALRPPPPPVPLVSPLLPHSAEADAATYDHCMQLARQEPAAAKKLADGWHERGGAHPAEHCAAVALIGLKQYAPAATRLEALAQDMLNSPMSLRADVLEQAGQAWLLAGDPGRAYAADGMALNLRPGDPDLLVDRAEAAGAARWYDKAVADLDQVLKADPERIDALVYRASADRALDHLEAALTDLDKALSLAPDSVPALLERGNLLSLKGNLDGARRDWARVAALAPGSPAAEAAKNHLERLGQQPAAAAPAPASRTP